MRHLSPTATDAEWLEELGHRLAGIRESRRLTMVEAAERAGLSRRTVSRAESGENPTLLTLIRLLRVYGRLGELQDFLRPPEVSPMARVRERRKSDG